MTNISCIREKAPCLPFIGLFVNMYNVLAIEGEIRAIQRGISQSDSSETQTKYLTLIRANEKGCAYAIYGIVGNVLSVALLAGLTALGILSGGRLLVWSIPFVCQAIILASNLAEHNKIIKFIKNSRFQGSF